MIRALRRSNASSVCMPEPMLHTVQALGDVSAGLRPLLRQGFRLLLQHSHPQGDGKPVDPMFAVGLQIFLYSADIFAATDINTTCWFSCIPCDFSSSQKRWCGFSS